MIMNSAIKTNGMRGVPALAALCACATLASA
jgi:hypothetical protein